MPLMVLGLAVMGFAELFIDPVAMSQITRIEIADQRALRVKMQNPALIRPRPRANFPQMRTVRLPPYRYVPVDQRLCGDALRHGAGVAGERERRR
jgi:hypothetical protein